MQGFRAAEFAGVDDLTRNAPEFVSLKQRGIGVRELGGLWEVPRLREHLLGGTKGVPLSVTLDMLRSEAGDTGESLADAFAAFPWRKFHWAVRALVQNSAVLAGYSYSFRQWLQHETADLGVTAFPPSDFQAIVNAPKGDETLERALRHRLERTFYMVGPALSAYMLSDWQLWLWKHGKTEVFATFKVDSFHGTFIDRFGRGAIPMDEEGFARWWLDLYPGLPPRLANECIWLGVERKVV